MPPYPARRKQPSDRGPWRLPQPYPPPASAYTGAEEDAHMDPKPPAFGISDRVTNLVVHAGDTLRPAIGDDGRDEYRFFDQGGTHYATLHGHFNPNDDFVVDAIAYHPGPDGGRKLLPVRPQPHTEAHPQPGTHSYANSITITQPPYTYTGDPPAFGDRPVVTISHEHEHPHTRDDDALAFAYRHDHTHEHTGPGTRDIWFNDHAREAHDHPHPDDDEPDRLPATG